MKRLKQTKESIPSESPATERFQLTFFNPHDSETENTIECVEINSFCDRGAVSHTISYIGDIFHPPKSTLYFS